MTDQEIFDKVTEHLLTQNKLSYNISHGWMYRGLDGLKCAVGCLIPDEIYDVSIERMPVSKLVHLNNKVADFLKQFNLPLLESLQYVHDSLSPHIWPKKLKEVAEKFELVYDNKPSTDISTSGAS